MNNSLKQPLVIILGPTAVGKTSISIELAKRLHGEIVSADSRLLYRGMDIGTAKPTEDEMKHIPHHLIDMADPNESWSLGVYQQAAYHVIDRIHCRGNLPFLVGGTGQYIRSIIEGWRVPSQGSDDDLRDAIIHWADLIGEEGLHKRLELVDPVAASNIDYRNLRRTIRALEVTFKTGERFSDLRQKQTCRYIPLTLGISRPREILYQRVDQRIEQMLDAGLVQEVRSLLEAGYLPELSPMSAIGYSEIIKYLQGEISLEEAVALIKRNTRVFVRRQANWFKPDDERIKWFTISVDDDEREVINVMETYLRRRINEI